MPQFRPLPPTKSIEEYEAEINASYPDLVQQQKEPPRPQSFARPSDCIALGVDDAGEMLRIEDKIRCEHMHVIGATGCGKSTFLLNCILQDIARGRGVCVLDPHGGHPDSLLNLVLRFLARSQMVCIQARAHHRTQCPRPRRRSQSPRPASEHRSCCSCGRPARGLWARVGRRGFPQDAADATCPAQHFHRALRRRSFRS